MKAQFWRRLADIMSGVSLAEIEDLRRSWETNKKAPTVPSRLRQIIDWIIYLSIGALMLSILYAIVREIRLI